MTRDLAALVARVLLVLLFLLSGVGKVMAFDGTVSYIASHSLPFPALETVIGVAVELGAGLLLLVGWKTRWAALILAIFTSWRRSCSTGTGPTPTPLPAWATTSTSGRTSRLPAAFS